MRAPSQLLPAITLQSAKNLPAKSARTAANTTMRGGFAPLFSTRRRYSHAASTATRATSIVNRNCHLGPKNTRSRTIGINIRAVIMRFILWLRIHCRVGLARVPAGESSKTDAGSRSSVSAFLLEQLHHVCTSVFRSQFQRRVAVDVHGIDAGSLFQKQLHHPGLAHDSRRHQRRQAAVIPGLDVGALFQ